MMKEYEVTDTPAAWEEQYFRETDRDVRRKILEDAAKEHGETAQIILCRKIWEARYLPVGKEPRHIDHFIRGYMNMYYIARSLKSVFHRKVADRDLDKIRADLMFSLLEEAEYAGSAEQTLYREYANMVRLYLELCLKDRSYGSAMFGVMRWKEEKLKKKIASDICGTAVRVPKAAGKEEEFSVFSRAARDTLYQMFPEDHTIFQEIFGAGESR